MKTKKEEILERYKQEVQVLRKNADELGVNDRELDQMFKECLEGINQELNTQKPKAQKILLKLLKVFIFLLCFTLFGYILLYVHQATSSIVLRNVQGLIYPGLKFIRVLSVPILKQFPRLTDFYDESCLVENPYFYVNDMECWPCEHVYSVIDLTGFSNYSLYRSGLPYIAKRKQRLIAFEDLKNTYGENKDLLLKEADNIISNSNIRNLKSLFELSEDIDKSSRTHVQWRINKFRPAQIIRSLFPRPHIISEWSGQSLERYIMIDKSDAPGYALPNMECSYIFLIQGTGERSIILKPSRECSGNCRTVSIVLKHPYVLWYNWWYWRPISLPVENSTETSITYMSSHC